MKQVLTDSERKKIRSGIYAAGSVEASQYKDGKIKFFIERCKGKVVLDLGSVDHFEGNWKSKYWLFKALLDNAKDLVGLDYYQEGVRALNEEGFNIVHGDAQDFQFDRKFEVITAGDLIEHLPNLDGFITSINNALVDGGSVLLSTPNPWCWKYMSYHLVFGKLDKVNREHVSWFCLQTLENLFSRYGFEIVDYAFSSRRPSENLMPLPASIKHTTLNIQLRKI